MTKMTMLLALIAVSAAMLTVPAFASAQTAHIDAISTLTVTGGESTWSQTGGVGRQATSIKGSGSFTTPTTGTLSLAYAGFIEESFGIKCGSVAQGHVETSGVITTTELTFHLITLATNKPGILITPNGATGIFAHFQCLGLSTIWTGTGLLGTITSPACGVASTKWTLSIRKSSNGHQEHKLYTGMTYDLHTNTAGATVAFDVPGDMVIHFPAARKIECTHTT